MVIIDNDLYEEEGQAGEQGNQQQAMNSGTERGSIFLEHDTVNYNILNKLA